MDTTSNFSLLQYGIENLTHTVLTHQNDSSLLKKRSSILVILEIKNVSVNDVRLSNGEIVEAGEEHISDPPQTLWFTVLPKIYNDIAMCKNYIFSKLARRNVEMFTDDILSYVVNLVKQCVPPKGTNYEAPAFIIQGDLSLIRHHIFEEEFVLRGLKKIVCESRESCAICLEDLSGARECAVTPCSHVFHSPCVATWLVRKENCPMCRTIIRVSR